MLVVCALETFLKLIPSSPTMLIQNFEIQFILNLNQPPTPSSLESIEPQKICNNQIVVAQLWWTLRKAICWDCTSVYFNLQRSLSLKRSIGKITFHLHLVIAWSLESFLPLTAVKLRINVFLYRVKKENLGLPKGSFGDVCESLVAWYSIHGARLKMWLEG